ncbi:MAG: hypothetical protein ACX930_03740 [Erythrobacter sp.]
MTAPFRTVPESYRQLSREAEHVLGDVVFQRSPVQSRLLRYLVDREISGLPPPTQYEIAVDGLGRDEDYDISSDSYPRVQISRLRKNLDEYYTRNKPAEGLRMALHPTSYRIKLAPLEQGAGRRAGLKRSFATARTEESPIWRSPIVLAGLIGLLIAGLAAVLLSTRPGGALREDANHERPRVALAIDKGASLRSGDLHARLAASTQQMAEIQLTNSLVSSFATRDVEEVGQADYNLEITIGDGVGEDAVAQISLRTSDRDLIYSNTVNYLKSTPGEFLSEVEATLVFLTSPNGVIADNEKETITDPLASDYACFLAIEDRRADGTNAYRLVEDCLAAFPDSELRAFWYARRAFYTYQNQLRSGRIPDRNGEAWDDIERAFAVDRFNPFANFIAAKVELANDRCKGALTYLEHAMDRGSSYPSLIAAMESEAAGCLEGDDARAFDVASMRSLARHNPAPDPLLHLYLMVATLATNDVELAARVARRRVIDDPQTPIEVTSDLLRQALTEPGFASANRERIKSNLSLFVWNERSVERTLSALAGRDGRQGRDASTDPQTPSNRNGA